MSLSKLLNPLSLLFPLQTPQPSKAPLSLQLKTPLLIPTTLKLKTLNIKEKTPNLHNDGSDYLSVAFPSLAFANVLYFNSAYNVQLIVGDGDWHEEKLIGEFRRKVLRAGVIQESKRRRFFESSQEKRKRKKRDAAKKNRKRRPPPKVSREVKAEEGSKKKNDDFDGDNWEIVDLVDIPYTS